MSRKGDKREKRGRKARREQARAQAAAAAETSRPSSAALTLVSSSGSAEAATSAAAQIVEVDLTDVASLIPEPPEHARRPHSDFAPRMPQPPRVDDETLSDHLVSLQPLYRAGDGAPGSGSEKVELEVEDLSLRMDNPYVASPLLSTPAPSSERSRAALVARFVGLVLVGASSSYGVWAAYRDLSAGALPRHVRAEPAAARVTQAQALPPPSRRTEAPADDPPHAAPTTLPVSAGPADDELARPSEPEPAHAQAVPAQEAEPTRAQPVPAQEAEPTPARAVPRDSAVVHAPLAAASAAPQAARSAPATQHAAVAATPAAGSAFAPVAPALAGAQPTVPAITGPLPKKPTPDALRASFAAIKPQLRACVPGRHGLATIRALITGNGRISQGTVEGVAETPDERACMARALLELRFPPFEQASFDIAFPLAL